MGKSRWIGFGFAPSLMKSGLGVGVRDGLGCVFLSINTSQLLVPDDLLLDGIFPLSL